MFEYRQWTGLRIPGQRKRRPFWRRLLAAFFAPVPRHHFADHPRGWARDSVARPVAPTAAPPAPPRRRSVVGDPLAELLRKRRLRH